jgi:hypothetical protein
MLRSLRTRFSAFLRAIKQSPINYATLGLKDPQLNKQY